MPFTFPTLQNPHNPNPQGGNRGPGDGNPQPVEHYGPQGPIGPQGPYAFRPGTQMGSANPGPMNLPGFMSPSKWGLPSMFAGQGLWGNTGGFAGLMAGGPIGGILGMTAGRYLAERLGGGAGNDTPWYEGQSGVNALIDANQAPSGEYAPQPISWGTPDDSGRYIVNPDGTMVDTQTGATYQNVGDEWRRQTSMGTYRGDSGFVTGVMGNIPMINPVAPDTGAGDEVEERMRSQVY